MRVPGAAGAAGKVNFRAQEHPMLELYRGHIGYGVEAGHRGRHYAERAVRLLLPFIRRHGFPAVWITCNPENKPSRRTCERLGAELVEIVELPDTEEMFKRGDRRKCRYRLDL
jgi:predicted acetyltransferase